MKGILSIIAVVSYAALATNLMAQPQLVVQSGHQEAVLALAVSPDKTLVASAGSDKTIIVWDLRNGKQLFNLKKHSAWIFCLAFSPDGRFLASGSADGNVWVWDIRRGVTVQGISLGKHAAVSIDFSPDGKILAVSGNFPSVFLWDLADQKQVARLKGHSDEI
jgi:WD40 repeat protein